MGGLNLEQIIIAALGAVVALFYGLFRLRSKQLFNSQTQVLEDQEHEELGPVEQAADASVADAEKAKEEFENAPKS